MVKLGCDCVDDLAEGRELFFFQQSRLMCWGSVLGCSVLCWSRRTMIGKRALCETAGESLIHFILACFDASKTEEAETAASAVGNG